MASLSTAVTFGQSVPLVPLDDEAATQPLLPAGISQSVPELFGNYAYVWTTEDGAQVVQYHGSFSFHLGARRLKSRQAVVWMHPREWEGKPYYHFEVFLSGHARVRDSAGAITTGSPLFVTLDTAQAAVLEADVTTEATSADTPLYAEATKVRQFVQRRSRLIQGLGADMEVVDLAGPPTAELPRARPVVRYRADEERIDEARRIIVATGDVYVSQGLIDSGDFLEIRADAAVLFLTHATPKGSGSDDPLSAQPGDAPAQPGDAPTDPALEPFPEETVEALDSTGTRSGAGVGGLGEGMGTGVAGVYLRGDVVLSRGERMIRASELYYDFQNDRALMLDAVMRALAPTREVPIYVRAHQVRQLSSTEYLARGARISSSEFYTPHVHIGAEEVYLTDLTPRDESGDITGIIAGRFRIHDATLNLEGVPVAYWPQVAGEFRQSETSIRGIRTAYSSDFGATLQTKWYMFNLLGLEEPEGVDAIWRLDYFSDRGPGTGYDIDYETENSFGLFRGYYIYDEGEDHLGPFRDGELKHHNRGRATWRHRELLGDGWEVTLEGSYISDPNFLEEYFNAEFEEGKKQESLIYLKKQEDNWAFTTLGQWRVLDFQTQTEHFPDLAFHLIGEPLADIASYYNESHIGFARFAPDNRRYIKSHRVLDNEERSDITFRQDTRNEIDIPIKLGNVNVVPFAMGRAGYWDGSPDGGARDRWFGTAGIRAGTQFWKLIKDVSSELLDVNGIRHIIRPEVTSWVSSSDTGSKQLHPFDPPVEEIDDFYGTSVALRQRWQTKRGGPGQWRVVDWIVFDVEVNVFGNQPEDEMPIGRFYDHRPEASVAQNHIRTDFLYRISDTTAVLSDSNIDLDDGALDMFNLSYAVERNPRLSYFLGYRYIGETDSNLIGGGANYRINTKHTLAVRSYFDLDRGKLEQFDVTIIRKFPRWYGALTFALDEIDDNFSVGVSVWPEGAPQAALGGQRYTRLTQSTGIRPEE